MKYLENYHLLELEKYCKNKCISIVICHHNECTNKIDYYREQYLGYLYGKRVARYFYTRKVSTNTKELYNHFKLQKNNTLKYRGTSEALYDLMRYVSEF